jgi:hypothetical protein
MGNPQPDGCILWTGNVDANGYGRMSPTLTGTAHVHRSAWILTHGPIPGKMTVEHSCHSKSRCTLGTGCPHRRCINPEHLGLLSHGANASLQHREPRLKCPKGHERRMQPGGQWYCPTCTSAAMEAWRAKDGNREAENAKRAQRRKRAAQVPQLSPGAPGSAAQWFGPLTEIFWEANHPKVPAAQPDATPGGAGPDGQPPGA